MSLTIHSLAARVLDTYEYTPDIDLAEAVRIEITPLLTTELFQMVVDDNRLAWLPVEPSKTPLHALKQVVSQEVLLVARRNLKGHRND